MKANVAKKPQFKKALEQFENIVVHFLQLHFLGCRDSCHI